jgi:hypothetical protein
MTAAQVYQIGLLAFAFRANSRVDCNHRQSPAAELISKPPGKPVNLIAQLVAPETIMHHDQSAAGTGP